MKSEKDLIQIASMFNIPGDIESIKEYGEGHINDSYYVKTKGKNSFDYILQRKNKNVFHPIPDMMNNMYKVTSHLKKKIEDRGGDPLRESVTIFPTSTGEYFYLDEDGEYWAICIFIPDHVLYQKAHNLDLAYKGGKGIGDFQKMLSDLTDPLADILTGFHNMRYRFRQWDKALSDDPVGRKVMLQTEISWVESRREEMLRMWYLIENKSIPTRVAHNDTKINNILFDKSDNVLCLIDLDTVMNSSILNDFGDAIRTYTNMGKEDDSNLDKVFMDYNIFKAFSEGYLEEALSFLTPLEIEYLAFSANYITFEQLLRFLMDYINGDTYYKIKSKDHNLIRSYAQYKLLQSIEEQYPEMKKWINQLAHS